MAKEKIMKVQVVPNPDLFKDNYTQASNPKTPDRRRVYACTVYPDSAPDNWRHILDDYHVPVLISPLHDKDINNGDGTLKKPHYHVLVMFDGKKSVDQWLTIRDSFGGVGTERIESTRGYARYLCHLDNPEKARYDTSEVTELGGAVYTDIIGNSYDKKRCISEMMSFIDRKGIYSYSQIFRFARYHNSDWFNCLLESSYCIKEYIAGCRLEMNILARNGKNNRIDSDLYEEV